MGAGDRRRANRITLRPELSRDRDAIRRVNELAFAGPTEADIVDALRDSDAWLPELSLVAEDDSGIVGHALFSLVRLDSGPELLSLGPMAVLPDHQRAAVGTALAQRGLELARGTEYPLVVVLGHPDYYPRFGFRPARRYGIETPYEAPDEAWMALPLPTYDESVRGTVLYPAPWGRV
jgi:putative acetyltransferase